MQVWTHLFSSGSLSLFTECTETSIGLTQGWSVIINKAGNLTSGQSQHSHSQQTTSTVTLYCKLLLIYSIYIGFYYKTERLLHKTSNTSSVSRAKSVKWVANSYIFVHYWSVCFAPGFSWMALWWLLWSFVSSELQEVLPSDRMWHPGRVYRVHRSLVSILCIPCWWKCHTALLHLNWFSLPHTQLFSHFERGPVYLTVAAVLVGWYPT